MNGDSAERWRRAGELLDAALELPAGELDAFLAVRCAADEALAREVRSLLAAHLAAGDSFLAEPAAVASAALIETDPSASDAPEIGQCVGPFRLAGELGRGGMGRVFLAQRVEGGFEQRVAVKILAPSASSEEAQRRFRLERQILARLDHPGIARLVDGGVLESGRTWFALEAVAGAPIDAHCRDRALDPRGRLELFVGVLDAVEYAHRSLIVHRDLKPGNVLVTAGGEIKLLDFGIAKILEPEESSGAAAPHTLLHALTPSYAAPEQLRREAVTTATDVYALGVLLFELLTGRLPWRDPERPVRSILEDEPLAPSVAVTESSRVRAGSPLALRRLRAELAGDLDAILLKALRKEPERRYTTVVAFTDDLKRHLDGRPVSARGDARSYRWSRFLARHRAAAAAVTLAALALAGGLFAALAEARHAQREARKAEKVQGFLLGILAASDPAQAKGAAVTVREVLDAGAAGIEADLGSEPEVEDRVLELVASVYLQLGEYDAALPLAERRVALRRQRFGSGTPEVAEAQLVSANILWDRGRLDEAEKVYTAASAVLASRQPPEAPASREALGGVAACLRARGDLAGAEVLQRRLLEIARRVDGPESEVALGIENSLAMTLGTGERYRESVALLGHIVAADERAGRADLPDGLTHRYNLAVDLARGGDWPGADRAFSTLLPTARRILGPTHPRLARALRWRAWLLDEQGTPGAASSALAECERIQVRALGVDDPEVAQTLALTARVAAHLGDAAEAEPQARAALAALARARGPSDPATAIGWESLASVMLAADRPAEARAAAEYAVALRRIPGIRGRSLAAALDLAADAARRAGDAAAAAELGRESLAIWQESAPLGHPEAARTGLHLAAAHAERGEAEAARALLAVARPVVEARFVAAAPERFELAELSSRLLGPP